MVACHTESKAWRREKSWHCEVINIAE